MRNWVRAGVALLVACGLVGAVGGGPAAAGGEDSVRGEGEFALGTFKFHARNSSDDPFDATGYFDGIGRFPTEMLVAPKGPITCLVVDGNRAGFLFPQNDAARPAFLKGQVLLISVEDAGKGGTDRIGFVGPAPAAFFPNCNPGATPLPVTSGDVTVNDARENHDQDD